MVGNCPKCNGFVSSVTVEPLDGNLGSTTAKCVAFLCPMCRAVLGVQVDPLAVKIDTVNSVVQKLRGEKG